MKNSKGRRKAMIDALFHPVSMPACPRVYADVTGVRPRKAWGNFDVTDGGAVDLDDLSRRVDLGRARFGV